MDRALEEALGLEPGERLARMLTLRDRVLTHDIHRWSRRFLSDAERVSAARDRGQAGG
jgi:trehalose 6-phosphate synthase/phosphatase